MKFIGPSDLILKHIQQVEGAVASKTTIPILSNIMIVAENNSLKLLATDLEIGIRTELPIRVENEGSVTVNAKKFIQNLKAFNDVDLEFELDESYKLNVKCTESRIKAKFTIQGLPIDNFPDVPEFIEDNYITVEQALIKRLIKKSIYSAAVEESRPFLCGVFFSWDDTNILNCVSTDGRRLALIKEEIPEIEKIENRNKIIPPKILKQLTSLLKEDGTCDITFTTKKVYFRIGNTELSSNLLEGRFPDYEAVIPSQFDYQIKIDNILFQEAIQRVSQMVEQKSYQIIIHIENDILTLSGKDPEHGSSYDELPVETNNLNISIGLNYRFLLDAIKEIDSDKLTIDLIDNEKPVIFRSEEEPNQLALIMPMRIESTNKEESNDSENNDDDSENNNDNSENNDDNSENNNE